jgi:hypothetical protein
MAGLSFPALRQPVFRGYFLGAASDDGRLDRAHHQLLDHVPEVPVAGAGIHLSLAASAALLLAITLVMLWTMVPSR